MRGQQDQRKINPSYRTGVAVNNFNNNNHSAHSLINVKQYQKPLLSRQRQNQRVVKDRSQNKYEDYQTTKGFKQYNSKHIKDVSATKSEALIKRSDHAHQPHIMSEVNQGISINVNIQNLITPKHLESMHNFGVLKEDRVSTEKHNVSHQEGKKTKKISNVKPNLDCFQFQCNEQLSCAITKRPSPTLEQGANKNQRQMKGLRQKGSQLLQKQKQKVMTPQEILKKFESEMDELNNNFEAESLIFLDSRQQIYLVSPKYIEKSQPNFTWKMRAQVVQWMMQVSYQYVLKRQTFHISVNLVDRYLQKKKNLPKSDFQLVGAASMFIASKLEEFEPKSSEQFVKATGFAVTAAKLKEMQRKICIALQYNLNPPTLYRWANRLMVQWDAYIKTNMQAQRHPSYSIASQILFKECDEESYIHFRILMQLIDCSSLDIQTAQYNPKVLVCAFMYLYIGKQTKFFSSRDIVHRFPYSSLYLLDQKNMYTDLFDNFVQFTFGFPLLDLLPTIQYCASYFSLPPNVEMPASKINPQAYENMELQQYCSIQTYDRNMYPIVNKRARDI